MSHRPLPAACMPDLFGSSEAPRPSSAPLAPLRRVAGGWMPAAR
ncbi:hypothetical protein [Hydrogenophaga sp.]